MLHFHVQNEMDMYIGEEAWGLYQRVKFSKINSRKLDYY